MSKTAISALQECLAKKTRPQPVYTEIALEYGLTPCFKIRCSCEGFDVDGEGPNKKAAKHRAAGKMIKLLESTKNYQFDYWPADSSPPLAEKSLNTSAFRLSRDSSPASSPMFINHVGKLSELCVSKKMLQPVYHEIPSTTLRPAHLPEFTIECKIGNVSVSRTASTKKQAKQDSAEAMRDLLREKYQVSNALDDPRILQQDIPAVNELPLENDNLKIKEAPELAAATAKAKNMYPLLKKSLGAVTYDPKTVSIGNFHKVFKASFDSETIKRFHEYWKSQTFEKTSSRRDLEIVLERICKILNLTAEKVTLKTKRLSEYLVGYKLNSKPEFIEIGMGETHEMALVSALLRSITTIHLLLI